MAKNSGKIFEQQFKISVPDYCLLHRLNDSPQAFKQSGLTRFTPTNPCDFFLFDPIARILYCLELKSTKNKFMTFEDIDSVEEQNKMIHKHQIKSLISFAKVENVVSGFLLNFRDEAHGTERTYFQDAVSFRRMCLSINKLSFNEMDLILNGAIKIEGKKKRVNYVWDINKFLTLKQCE